MCITEVKESAINIAPIAIDNKKPYILSILCCFLYGFLKYLREPIKTYFIICPA
ncbi:hypothetical protein EV356DRAFT_551296 [Viridothelium virens]|uniref:Uncharacterized protein n=1 Tax=Viridothelium virens TaxID=1048519 RepID=A0A6A6GSN1_VIRVR|nr:hypothetical protein EV356DRAFT_551296 [Viridothelium virens]